MPFGNSRSNVQDLKSGAATTGQIAAYTTAGVKGKRWVTAGDELVRETHQALHRAVIPVEDDFAIGIGHGPGPGQSGIAAEDVGCRCSLQPVAAPKVLTETHENGHHRIDELGMRLLLESVEVHA